MLQGKATETDRALIGRSDGAITLLTAIEGNEKAMENIRAAAGKQLREVASESPAGDVRYRYAGKTSDGIKKYITDFPADMDYEVREKVFKERIATVFNLGAVKLNTDTKKIQVLGDRFTVQKNIYGDDKASDTEMSAKINSLYDIAEILSDAKFVGKGIEPSYADPTVKPQNAAHKDIKYWYYFKNTISMDGEIYDVVFNIRDKGREQYQYLFKFTEKNKRTTRISHTVEKTSDVNIDELSSTDRIPQNAESVNTYSMQDGEIYSQGEKASIPEKAKIRNNIVLNDGSLSFRRNNPTGYKVIEKMAKDLGMRVRFVKGLYTEKYNPSVGDADSSLYTREPLDGVITSEGIFINTESKNPTRFAAMHEFSHRMKQTAPKQWAEYQEYCINKLKADGRYYKAFDLKAAAYGTENESYIDEEIACDFIGEVFENESELADFILSDRPLTVKVRDVWYSILDRLELLDEKKKVQLMWRKVYKEAVLNKDVEYNGSKASQMRSAEGQSIEERIFGVEKDVVQRFSNALDEFQNNKNKLKILLEISSRTPKIVSEIQNISDTLRKKISICKTPFVLQCIGADDLNISIASSVINKATDEIDEAHSMSVNSLKSLPAELADPIMVFDSERNKERKLHSLVVLTSITNQKGHEAIVILQLNKKEGFAEINDIVSVYSKTDKEGRNKIYGFIKNQIENGNLRYINKEKSDRWLRTSRLQLPTVNAIIASNNNILQKEDIVNTYSMRNGEIYSQGEKASIPEKAKIRNNIVLDDESLSFRRNNPTGYKVIEKMAKDLGMRVRFVKGLYTEKYNPSVGDADSSLYTREPLDGVITSEGIFINTESKNPTRFAATHEFSHRMKQTAPKQWAKYQEYVINKLKVDGRYYKAFDVKAAAYGTENESYIDEEIACDFIGEVFENESELADFILSDRPLAVKVRDVWYSILDKLELLDEKKKVQQMWRKVYKEAVLNKDVEFVGEKSKINPTFERAFDNWVHNLNRKSGITLKVGSTSEALISIGVREQTIYWDTTKINDTLKKHPDISIATLRTIPDLIENPVLIMEERNKKANKEHGNNRIFMLGELYNENEIPVVVFLELESKNKDGVYLNEIKVISTYAKVDETAPESINNTRAFVKNSHLLYLDPNKNRTNNWLARTGLQLPFLPTTYGPINKISYSDDFVNTYSMQDDGNYPKKSVSGTRLSELEELQAENKELRAQLENMNLFNVSKSAQYGAEVRRAAQDMKTINNAYFVVK